MHLFKHGRDAKFPAFLTWRAKLDKKSVMNLLPPLTDGGFRSERISKMLCELHALEYDDACLEHEYEIKREKANPLNTKQYQPLGNYNDEKTWRGKVPTAAYIDHARKLYHESIKPYLDKSVKKRGAESLHWDVSFKEAKHLCRYW